MRKLVAALSLSLASALLASTALGGGGAKAPDFSGPIVTKKFERKEGRQKLLAILWNQHGPYRTPAPKEVEERLFGAKASVDGWLRENSNGKFSLEKAGIVGWYDADHPAEHYWPPKPLNDEKDSAKTGWLWGDREKWAEAIRKASKDFKFSDYDANHDGVLTPDELAIIIVIPKDSPYGTNRTPVGRDVPKEEPLTVQGVTISAIAEWYTGDPPALGTPVHELNHLYLGAPDLYFAHAFKHQAGLYSVMDNGYSTVHLDPFEKLKHGWLSYRTVTASGEHALRDVETGHEVLILYDPTHGPKEYFLLENRWRGTSYDAGVPSLERGIPADGLAVWDIIEDPALMEKAGFPPGEPRTQKLIRRNGGAPIDDREALFGEKDARLDLTWTDGSKSPFSVKVLSKSGPEIRVGVTFEQR